MSLSVVSLKEFNRLQKRGVKFILVEQLGDEFKLVFLGKNNPIEKRPLVPQRSIKENLLIVNNVLDERFIDSLTDLSIVLNDDKSLREMKRMIKKFHHLKNDFSHFIEHIKNVYCNPKPGVNKHSWRRKRR